jgi:copper chaperone
METVTYTAPDISCAHCQRMIESALVALVGVRDARVEVPRKTVTVTFDPTRISPREIEATLSEEGYPVRR